MPVRNPKEITRARFTHRNETRSVLGRVFWTESENGADYLTGWEDAPRRFATQPLQPGVGYGGGAFNAAAAALFFAGAGRVWRVGDSEEPRALTPAFGAAADPVVSPDGEKVVYVSHYEGEDVLAMAPASGGGWPRAWVRGADFYMQPAWSRAADRLAWVEWDKPNMPWDGSRLMIAEVNGWELGSPKQLAGGPRTPVFQPLFTPDGKGLVWLENPQEEEFDRLVHLDLESGEKSVWLQGAALLDPAWTQGQRLMSFGPGGALYLRENRRGRAVLWRISPAAKEEEPLPAGISWLSSLSGDEHGLAAVASGSLLGERIIFYDGEGWRVRAYSWPRGCDGGVEPEQVVFSGAEGSEVYGFYYPPADAAPNPPAVVNVHGGPTSQRTLLFNAQAQLFSQNGYGYLELNYRGSTGYGRSYREALYGNWGVVDVADALAAARYLGESGRADASRLAIMGGSAGGYTTLMTLALHPGVYRAGVSLFGVTDLFLLARDTHKFESAYCDKLAGPLPQAAELYRRRSPLTHAHKIKDALYVFQGADDKVVPPNQAEELVRILRENGVPHRYKVYPGEGHGWKKPETIEDFYRETLDFLERELKFS